MWWLLGVAVWVGVIIWLVMSYQRKMGGRNRERDAQLEQMMAEVRAAKGAPAAAAVAPAGVASAVPGMAVPPLATGGPPWHGRERLLDPPRGLIYLLLRTGLPEHEIFANLTLADVHSLGASAQGPEREQRLRRLQQTRVDFVVCTRRLQPVAVVALREATADAAGKGATDAAVVERVRFTEECLAVAALRYVTLDPASPPRHGEIRGLVLGG